MKRERAKTWTMRTDAGKNQNCCSFCLTHMHCECSSTDLKSNYEHLRALARGGFERWGARVYVCVYILYVLGHTNAHWLLKMLAIFLLLFPIYLSLSLSASQYVYSWTACWPHSDKLRIHGTSQHFEKVQSCRPKQLREAVHREASYESLFFFTPQLPLLCCHAPSRLW